MTTKVSAIELFRPFTRHTSTPIDITSVFTSLDDAKEYAASNPAAYAGQIISVIYPVELKIELYVVSYNTTMSSAKYVLDDLATGTSGSSGFKSFNYIGRIQSFKILSRLISNQGDLCYIIDDQTYYVYNGTEWNSIDLFTSYASETSDGIITSDEYSSLINKSNKPAIYYNDNKDTALSSNKWIEVSLDKLDTTNVSIPTLRSVVNLIDTRLDNQKPSIKLKSIIPTDVYYANPITPQFDIIYSKNLGGNLEYINVYREDSLGAKYLILILYPIDFTVLDNGDLLFRFVDNTSSETYTGAINTSLVYDIEAYYTGNDVYTASYTTESIRYNFYDVIEYNFIGNASNENTKLTLNTDTLVLTISDENISGLRLILPVNKIIKSIEFSNQPNIDVLDMFTVTEIGTTKLQYLLVLPDIDGFEIGTKFIIKL